MSSRLLPNIKFGNQFIASAIKFRKCFSKFMIPTTLLEKFDCKKVQVGKDHEKAQSEKDSHSKNRGGKKPN